MMFYLIQGWRQSRHIKKAANICTFNEWLPGCDLLLCIENDYTTGKIHFFQLRLKFKLFMNLEQLLTAGIEKYTMPIWQYSCVIHITCTCHGIGLCTGRLALWSVSFYKWIAREKTSGYRPNHKIFRYPQDYIAWAPLILILRRHYLILQFNQATLRNYREG